MGTYDTMVRFFQDGGAFMYPIAAVLALGIAISIERFIYLGGVRRADRHDLQEVMDRVKRRDYAGALEFARGSKAAIGRILGYGLERAQSSSQREDIETAMEEGLIEVLPHLEKRTHYLAIFSNVATLLGLLGTIIGLIQAFTAVSAANPAEKADMLSASISVAMNTTAFGLISAIPLLLAHAVLQTKTNEMIDGLEMASVKFLNAITAASTRVGAGTSAR
ncbi:MAG: MotA/TolQ/ExbB proton channel family protein [Chromatiales bacterium]|jgi:biopolymer transport protein ExbB/TolQ|nr:MotA/TolQ/ExbB proton channel family protein [Chromatiales bacterium]